MLTQLCSPALCCSALRRPSMLQLPATAADDMAAVAWLATQHGVCVIPGTACGAPGHIRVAYANLAVEKIAEVGETLWRWAETLCDNGRGRPVRGCMLRCTNPGLARLRCPLKFVVPAAVPRRGSRALSQLPPICPTHHRNFGPALLTPERPDVRLCICLPILAGMRAPEERSARAIVHRHAAGLRSATVAPFHTQPARRAKAGIEGQGICRPMTRRAGRQCTTPERCRHTAKTA